MNKKLISIPIILIGIFAYFFTKKINDKSSLVTIEFDFESLPYLIWNSENKNVFIYVPNEFLTILDQDERTYLDFKTRKLKEILSSLDDVSNEVEIYINPIFEENLIIKRDNTKIPIEDIIFGKLRTPYKLIDTKKIYTNGKH
jgi:hypothetical protein